MSSTNKIFKNYLVHGLLVISSDGHGSPSNDFSVNAAPSANDFRQYPPLKYPC